MTAEETAALKQEAQDYGMVMSNEAVAASAAFEDSLTRLNGTMSGLKNRMVGELLPGITLILDGLSDLVAGNEQAGEELKKAKSIERFTLALRKRQDVLTEFDNILWLTTVDSATVHADGRITFLFRSGTEITV